MIKKIFNRAFGNRVIIALLSVIFLASCQKTFTLGTLTKVDNSFSNNSYIKNVLFNHDGTRAYVLNNDNEIFTVNLKNGLKGFNDKENWKELSLIDKTKNNSPGKAKIDDKVQLENQEIYLGQKGVIVTATFGDTSVLAYFEGDALVPTYTWLDTQDHCEKGIKVNKFSQILAVYQDGLEYLIIIDDENAAFSLKVGQNKISGRHKVPVKHGFFYDVLMVESEDAIFFVDEDGVYTLVKSKLGTNSDAEKIEEANSNLWKIDSSTNNNSVNDALIHQGRLYIALHAFSKNTGGIVVYDIAQKTLIAPKKNIWDQVTLHNLSVYKNNVYSLADNNYTQIQQNGIVGKYHISEKSINRDSLARAAARSEDISSKVFYNGDIKNLDNFHRIYPYGDDLVILDTSDNAFTLTYEQVPVSDYIK